MTWRMKERQKIIIFFSVCGSKMGSYGRGKKPMHQLFTPRQPFRVLLLIKIMRKRRSKKKIMSNGKEFK